jgi:hypothetical protein
VFLLDGELPEQVGAEELLEAVFSHVGTPPLRG